MTQTIYLDMDGVVADWISAVTQITGKTLIEGERWSDSEWRQLVQFQRIYQNLPLMRDARFLVQQTELIAAEHKYEVKFLTAVPRRNDFPHAFEDKVNWARQYWPHIPVWFGPYSEDKKRKSAPGQVLIDDRADNIQQWNEAGGCGILYTGWANPALTQLRSYING